MYNTIVNKTLSHPYRVEIKINSTKEDMEEQKLNIKDKMSALKGEKAAT